MRQPLPMIVAVSACLMLGGLLVDGVTAGVQPRIDAASASHEMARTLAAETHRRLAEEFVQQQVDFELAGTRVWPGEAGHWRVRAEGTADFGADGQATTTIDAVYDVHAARWVELEYQLL